MYLVRVTLPKIGDDERYLFADMETARKFALHAIERKDVVAVSTENIGEKVRMYRGELWSYFRDM